MILHFATINIRDWYNRIRVKVNGVVHFVSSGGGAQDIPGIPSDLIKLK